MAKNKLPIDRMSGEEFDNFRKSKLNEDYLDGVGLIQIAKLFGVRDNDFVAFRVNCDEAHAHDYRCLEFSNRSSAVVLKLLEDIRGYRKKLDVIRQKTGYRR